MTIFYYSSQSRQKEENHNYNHESQIIDVSLPSALLSVTCLMRLLAGRQSERENTALQAFVVLYSKAQEHS